VVRMQVISLSLACPAPAAAGVDSLRVGCVWGIVFIVESSSLVLALAGIGLLAIVSFSGHATKRNRRLRDPVALTASRLCQPDGERLYPPARSASAQSLSREEARLADLGSPR